MAGKTTERHFETSLRELREQLVSMAGQAEKAIGTATLALQTNNPEKISEVYEIEKSVNQSHITIDDGCLKILALQQPLAADLRMVVAMIKMNTDLERMGDQAVNIAKKSERYLKGVPFRPLPDLQTMLAEVRSMVRLAIDSFVQWDEPLARSVLAQDDRIDSLKHKLFRDILDLLKTQPLDIEQGLTLILISRNLEKIGDHATNIAEDVIFALSGLDIRHSPRTPIGGSHA